MIKHGMALVGQSVTTNEISKLQRRAGINVTGVLDTKKITFDSSLRGQRR